LGKNNVIEAWRILPAIRYRRAKAGVGGDLKDTFSKILLEQ